MYCYLVQLTLAYFLISPVRKKPSDLGMGFVTGSADQRSYGGTFTIDAMSLADRAEERHHQVMES